MNDAAITVEAEKQRWHRNAVAWTGWADHMAEMAEKLNGPILDAAGVGPGARLLDLASGVGEPLLTAAARVGAEGIAIGCDLSPAMLAGAAARRDRDGRRAPLSAADMTALPFESASFDAVTCRFGLMFVPEPPLALREIMRVLRPGGKAALMVWGPRTENTIFEVLQSVIAPYRERFDDLPPAPQFRYGDRDLLLADLAAGGFGDAVLHDITPLRRVPLDPPFWHSARDMGYRTVIERLSEPEQKQLDEEIASAFAARVVDDPERGKVVPLAVHAVMISAHKPA